MKKILLSQILVWSLGSFSVAMAADGFSGFVDAQYNWVKQTKGNGFTLNDGALYYAKTIGTTDFFLDIPFAWDNSAAAAGTNDFKFGKEKAQAFFGLNYQVKDSSYRLQVGQFDSSLGLESNDSIDNPFTMDSLVETNSIPFTHTGVMLSANCHGFFAQGIASNANVLDASGTGYNSSGSRNSENIEVGAVFGYSADLYHFQAGYLGHNQAGVAGMQSLYNVTAGTSLKMVDVDVEGSFIKVGGASMQKGAVVQALVKPDDKFSFGGRGEILSKLGAHHATQVTVGPQYQVYQPLKVKADITWNKTQATAGSDKATTTTANVAALYKF
jgi:hypothetical protein